MTQKTNNNKKNNMKKIATLLAVTCVLSTTSNIFSLDPLEILKGNANTIKVGLPKVYADTLSTSEPLNRIMKNVYTNSSSNYTFVVKNDGKVWVCGANSNKEFGGTLTTIKTPIELDNIDSVKSVHPCLDSVLYLKNDGTVWAQGTNANGVFGNGSSSAPSKKSDVQQINISGVSDIVVGNNRTFFIKYDGTVWACGNNMSGQLGVGDTVTKTLPTQVQISNVKKVVSSSTQTFFMKNDGTIWACGSNISGQLAIGNTTATIKVPTQVTAISNVKDVATGGGFTHFLKYDGTVWAVGGNGVGQLALGDTVTRKTPTQVNIYGVSSISAGNDFIIFVKNDGTVWGAGNNTMGQLATGDTVAKKVPTQVYGMSGVTNVLTGLSHVFYLKNDGTIWGVGGNTNGQLGTGNTTSQKAPIQVFSGWTSNDTTPPTMTLTPSTTATTNGTVTITANASDEPNGSEMKRIQTPDGNWVNGSNVSFTVNYNGDYVFVAEDNAGNQTTKTIQIRNIDSSISNEDFKWLNNTGTPASDVGNFVFKSSDGCTVIGSSTGLVSKIDPNGKISWSTKTAKGTSTFDSAGVPCNDGGVIVTHDCQYITKIAKNGAVLWDKQLLLDAGMKPVNEGSVLAKLPNGHFVGLFEHGYQVLGSNGAYNSTSYQIIAIEFDENGNKVNQAYFNNYLPKSNIVINDDGSMVFFASTLVYGGASYTGENVLMKLNPDLSVSYKKLISILSPTETQIKDDKLVMGPLSKDNNGNYYVFTNKSIKTDSGISKAHGVILKLDPYGNVNSEIDLGANSGLNLNGYTKFLDGAVVSDGIIAVGTSSSSTGTILTPYHGGVTDAIAVKYDFDGNLLWSKNFGGSGEDVFSNMTIDNDGSVVAVGYSTSSDGDIVINRGSRDTIVAKLIPGNSDTTAPTLNLSQTPTSWTNGSVTITANANDEPGGSGIKQITLPDSSTVSGSSANYAVTANGTYKFITEDKAGNKTTQSITISNIDTVKPTVSLIQNPTGWTNGNVSITANASDVGSGVKSITLPNGTVVNGSIANYIATSNNNYSFIVEDNAGNKTIQNITVSNIDTDKPTLSLTQNPTGWTNGNITITAKANDSGSGVKSITLPDNTVVNGSTANYTATSNNTYSFIVEDNAGNKTTQSITISNIDKGLPNLSLSADKTSLTNGKVTITAIGSDSLSGVKRIQTPDGNWTNASTVNYSVTSNGTYTFTVEDNAGNQSSGNFTISNIDNNLPTLDLKEDITTPTKEPVTITATASDVESGIKRIQNPDGSWTTGSTSNYKVSTNGTYTFIAEDGVGNQTSKSINITNIDNELPTLTVDQSPTTWTNGDVILTATATDTGSGVKRIQKPDGTWVSGSTASFTVNVNGTYTFIAEDNVGNQAIKSVNVTNIDKVAPTLSVTQTVLSSRNISLTATGSDVESGVKRIQTPDGNWVNGNTVSYSVTKNGTYKFIVEDNAGNQSTQTVDITSIDSIAPTLIVTPDVTTPTKGNVIISGIATDDKGVKRVQLPDGTWVDGDHVNYTVTKNGTYTFIAEDTSGNQTTKTIEVSNIDKDLPSLSIVEKPDTPTNKDVSLVVTGTDIGSGVKRIQTPDGKWIDGSTVTYTVTKNDTYSFTVEDNAGNQSTKSIDVTNIDKIAPTLSLTQDVSSLTNGNVVITAIGSDPESGVKRIQTPDGKWVDGNTTKYTVTTNGIYSFTVEDNAGNQTTKSIDITNIDSVKPVITLTQTPTDWTNKDVTINVSVSDTGSGVKQIIMPNNSIVSSDSGSFVVSSNGTYTFKAIDNAGNEITKDITISNIDKVAPDVTLSQDITTWSASNVKITVNATDAESGVATIKLPDKSVINTSTGTFTATTNGTYDFVVTDKAGNQTTKSITISNIDNTAPVITIEQTPKEITNKDVTLNVSATDIGSGVTKIQIPDGTWVNGSATSITVTTNGTYTFVAEDKAGNQTSQSINVTNIDKKAPALTLTQNPTDWTNGTVTISFNATDETGIKQVIMPDNTVSNSNNGTFTVSTNGTYTFKAIDVAGNEITKDITISNIDKIAPDVTLSQDITTWTTSNVKITVNATDAESGVATIKLPDKTVIKASTGTFTATANGTYDFVVTDKAGNQTTKSITISNIDNTAPTLTLTQNPTDWTKDTVTITATSVDTGSGVKSITLPDGTVVNGDKVTFTVSNNGTYTFTSTDSTGNIVTQSITISNIDNTAPTLNLTQNPTTPTNGNVTITATASDTGSGVKSITLPNGAVINSDNATYIVSSNGKYDFSVVDNLGNVTNQSITVSNIDTVAPTLLLTPSTTAWTKDPVIITATGYDVGSGVKNITLPDGTIVNSSTTTFIAKVNGDYKFTISDNAGNETTKSITISNIDVTAPNVNIVQSPTDWTKGNVTLSVSATDDQSGVKSITLPDGIVINGGSATFNVSTNGTYTFQVSDNIGNIVNKTVTVGNIDNTPPILTLTKPITWSNTNTVILAKAEDSISGVKEIILPNGNIVNGSTANYAVDEPGVYYFTAVDNVGNTTTNYIIVDNIDNVKPTVDITNNQDWTNANSVPVKITGSDK